MGAPIKTLKDHLKRLDMRDPEACWPWPLSQNGDGYGQLTEYYVSHRAHKYFYERLVEPVREGMVLDHTCHDPEECIGGKTCPHRKCCNPTHLAQVTTQENLLRGNTKAANNAAKTHCNNGHELSPDNLVPRPGRNSRECRVCHNARARKYDLERKKSNAK